MSGHTPTVAAVLDLLIPPRCAVCAAAGAALCRRCATALPGAPDLAPPAGLQACWALLSYDRTTRDLVAALKYRRHREVVRAVAPALATLLDGLLSPPHPGAACVTWAPTSGRRRRRRGYDQAELLARGTATAAGVPLQRLLTRLPGPAQTGRDRVHRLDGPAFRALQAPPATVVVLDDVWTTGATLSAAASALRNAGATHVLGLVLAVRP